jgi:hypothetical protein
VKSSENLQAGERVSTSQGLSPANIPEPVVLMMADISGYTRYMTANAKTLAHSQTIITELVTAIVREVELPLTVAKLEGDAVFMFCRKNSFQENWPSIRETLGRKLLRFFELFNEKAAELSRSTTCTCSACAHIEKLRLKLIVHSGQALFHRIVNFEELAGVDVILLHRLLKNSVDADQYLLVTEAGNQDLILPGHLPSSRGQEKYEDFGLIQTMVYLPAQGDQPSHQAIPGFSSRAGASARVFSTLWFSPFTNATKNKKFTHLESSASQGSRSAFKLFTLLLTPLMLPVGLVFAMFHALKTPPSVRHSHDDHEHRADGSCCQRH